MIIKKTPRLSVFFIPLVYAPFGVFASSVYLSANEVFIIEQRRFSGFNFSAIYYALFWLLLIFVSVFLMGCLRGRHIPFFRAFFSGRRLQVRFVWILVVFIFAVVYTNLFLSPIPFFDGLSRFEFWQNARFPIIQIVFGQTTGVLAFLLGLLFYVCGSVWKRLAVVLMFSLYIAYLILIGNKFSAVFLALVSFSLPYLVSREKINFDVRFIMAISVAVIALFALIYINYSKSASDYQRHLGFNVFESIFYRIAGLQGHLYWGAVEDSSLLSGDYNSDWLYRPMHAFMFHHAGDLAQDSIARGVSMTNAFPANFVSYAGILPGLAISVLVFCLIIISGNLLVSAISSFDFFSAIIHWQTFTWICYGVFMGYPEYIIRSFVVLLAAYLITSLVVNLRFPGRSAQSRRYDELNGDA